MPELNTRDKDYYEEFKKAIQPLSLTPEQESLRKSNAFKVDTLNTQLYLLEHRIDGLNKQREVEKDSEEVKIISMDIAQAICERERIFKRIEVCGWIDNSLDAKYRKYNPIYK